jgi:mono/diheme cytochrome c family protein
LLILVWTTLAAGATHAQKSGQQLYKQNCAAC